MKNIPALTKTALVLTVCGALNGSAFECSEAVRAKARDFIDNERQFHLGFLPTERSNPVTATLEEDFGRSVLAGVQCLQRADRQMPIVLRHVLAGREYRKLVEAMVAMLKSPKGRMIFSGCGATGRLSIVLESMWRDFFHRRAGELTDAERALADRSASIMTGGDFALIRSVEAFEDFASGGARQAELLGVGRDDVFVAITEGGETSSVLGTLRYAADHGAACFLLFNNPADVLREHLTRSREAIDDPRVTVLDLYCGSMALAGSTRMQATSSEQMVVSSAMEQALARVLPRFAAETSVDAVGDFETLLSGLESRAARAGLVAAIELEESVYRRSGRITYYSDDCMLDLFTDTTERSPTFMLPPFRGTAERNMAQSWAFVKNPLWRTEECWRRLFHRDIRCLEFKSADYADMGFPERVVRKSPKISKSDFLAYLIGNEAPEDRLAGVAESVGVVVTVGDKPAPFMKAALGEVARYTKRAEIHIGEVKTDGIWVKMPIKPSALEIWKHLAVKLAFNTLSTGTMVRMGRVSGNWMSWVSISNKKLVDRGIRLLVELGEIDYEEAALRLFDAEEWVASQDWTGREMPCAVQVALSRLGK